MPLSSCVDLCGKSWQWWWYCAPFVVAPLRIRPLCARISRLWAQADPSATARRLNQPLPSTQWCPSLCLYRPKVSDAHLKLIWNALRCLFMLHGTRNHKIISPNNVKKVIKSLEACKKPCTSIANSINKEMWYIIILICMPDSDLWLLDGSSLCTCCDCNLSCHGRTAERARRGKETNDRRNLWCNSYVWSPVLTNIKGFSCITAIVFPGLCWKNGEEKPHKKNQKKGPLTLILANSIL